MRRLAFISPALLLAAAMSISSVGAQSGDTVFACPGAPSALEGSVFADHETPTRAEVQAALIAVTPRVMACAVGDGVAQVGMDFIGATGHVVRVSAHAEGPATPVELECIAQAACAVVVPPFRRAEFRVNFPFRY